MELSFKIKLNTDQEQKETLHEIMFAYNSACNHISRVAFKNKVFNNFSLHHMLYNEIRTKFGLPADLTCTAFRKVAYAYKTELTKASKEKREISLCKFKKHSAVTYNEKLLTYGKENIVSLKTLLPKRLKLATFIHEPSKIPFFKGEADLIYSRNNFYIVQTINVPKASPIDIKDYLGLDLGIVKVAVDSDGEIYTNDKIEAKRIKYSLQRQRLAKVKTKSSRRHLKKLGDKEARFRKDVNHCISKQIVQKAEHTHRGIALESLVQFFDKTRVRKDYRAQRCSWSFFQLRSFVNYKAVLKGVPVVLVDPRDTSRRCSECGYISENNRKSQASFICTNPDLDCKHSENADFNASKNIKYWAGVNQPIVANLGLS